MASRRHQEYDFAPEPRNESRARHALGDAIDAWGYTGHRRALELAVSELFVNAVVHGRGQVRVALAAEDGIVRLEVRDHGGGRPEMQEADASGDRIGGWGLRLVDQLSDAWGSEVDDGTTTVWAEWHSVPHLPGPSSASS